MSDETRHIGVMPALIAEAREVLEGNLPGAVIGRQREERSYGQGTASVRTLDKTESEVDVVRFDDEHVVAGHNLGDDGSIPVSGVIGNAPRSACYQFTVARAVEVGAIELLACAHDDGASGDFWVSIWSGDPNPNTFVGLLGRFAAARLPEPSTVTKALVYLSVPEGGEIALVPGTTYWICIGGGDPEQAAPPAACLWDGQALYVRKELDVGGTIGVMHTDTAVGGAHRPPYAAFGVHTDSALWYRLYARHHIVRSVPITPGALIGSTGEAGVMNRVYGYHPLRHVTSARGGASSASGARLGVGEEGPSAGGPGGPFWLALTANQPFAAGAVIYADAAGALAHDAPNFFWNAGTQRLGLGLGALAPNYQVHIGGVASSGFADQIASAAAGDAPRYLLRRSRGTLAAPGTVLNNDVLGNIVVHGHDGTAWGTAGIMRFQAAEVWAVGAHGTQLAIWLPLIGAAGTTEQLRIRNGQVRILGGTAAAPALAKLTDLATGMFWPAANMMSLAAGGTEYLRVRAGNIQLLSAVAGPGPLLQFAGDRPVSLWLDQTLGGGGNAQDLYQSTHSGAKHFRWGQSAGLYTRAAFVETMRLYVGAANLGQLEANAGTAALPFFTWIVDADTGMFHVGANVLGFSAQGNYQLGVHADHLWIDPTAYVCAADGDVSMDPTRNAMKFREGGVERTVKGQTNVKVTTFTKVNVAGPVNFATYTIPAAAWAIGKTWHFIIGGQFDLVVGGGGGSTITINVELGGNEIGRVYITNGAADPARSGYWTIECVFTCRTLAVAGTVSYLGHGAEQTAVAAASVDARAGVLAGAAPDPALDTTANQVLRVRFASNPAVAASGAELQTWVFWED